MRRRGPYICARNLPGGVRCGMMFASRRALGVHERMVHS